MFVVVYFWECIWMPSLCLSSTNSKLGCYLSAVYFFQISSSIWNLCLFNVNHLEVFWCCNWEGKTSCQDVSWMIIHIWFIYLFYLQLIWQIFINWHKINFLIINVRTQLFFTGLLSFYILNLIFLIIVPQGDREAEAVWDDL